MSGRDNGLDGISIELFFTRKNRQLLKATLGASGGSVCQHRKNVVEYQFTGFLYLVS